MNKLSRKQILFNLLKHVSEDNAMSITDIYEYIKGQGVEISRKTVERDIIDASSEYNILEVEGTPSLFYTDSDFRPEYYLGFSEEELEIITLALDNLKQTSPKYMRDLCLKAEVTLSSKLPLPLSKELKRLKDLHHFSYGINGRAITKDNHSFKVIMSCLRREISFTCQNLSPYKDEEYNSRVRQFSPLLFHMSGGTPYLIARDLDDGQIKSLRMTRLISASELDRPVKKLSKIEEKDFNYLFGGFGGKENKLTEFEIVGDKVLATYFLEREIHSSQEVTEDNGKYIVKFILFDSQQITRILKGLEDHIYSVCPEWVLKKTA